MEGVVVSSEFWRGRRVLVTGITGFKGTWLAMWLHELGANVWGYSLRPPTTPSLFRAVDSASTVKWIEGDVRDRARVRDALQECRSEIVFHLAAQPLVRISYEMPVETFEANVLGTVNVLEALRHEATIRAIVVVTTDKCYENREWCWPYRESDSLGGHDPYSSSKACAELVASAYRRSFYADRGIGLATARAGNVLGGGDWACDRLLPDTMIKLAAGEPALVRNPKSVRPWQHVLDALQGYLLLAERLAGNAAAYGESWNFGPQEESLRSVSELVDMACAMWGDGARWQSRELVQPHEANQLVLDSSKARGRLGWRTRLHLSEALEWSVAWYKAYRDGHNMRNFSLSQIRRYSEIPA